jgi:predicted Zn-dependent protease with MMP-like domain
MEPDDLENKLDQLYQSAQVASSEGLHEEALDRCDEGLRLIESNGDEGDRHSYSDFVMLTGDIHWGAGDYEEAFVAYQRVALHDPERTDARVAMGVALFHLCRFHASRAILEAVTVEHPDDGEAWYYLGLLALRDGKRDLAQTHFFRAHESDEERYFLPVDITEEEIIRIVEQQIADIPAELHESLENLPILIEALPGEELLMASDPPLDPTLLGIFEGTPLPEQSSMDPVTSPTRIVLFLENIRMVSRDRQELEDELWVTLKHEIGHFYGLDEDELEARGLQ